MNMWLRDASIYKVSWFHDHEIVKGGYAILPHAYDEVSFQDMSNLVRSRQMPGFKKSKCAVRWRFKTIYTLKDWSFEDTRMLNSTDAATTSAACVLPVVRVSSVPRR